MKSKLLIKKMSRERWLAIKTASIYILFGVLWVVISDELIFFIASDMDSFIEYEIVKALVFIFITGLLLYNLIFRDFRKIEQLHSERQQAVKALQGVEAKERTLLNVIPDFIFRMDGKGTILNSNVSGKRNTVIDLTDIDGKNMFDIFPELVAKDAIMYIKKALNTNQIQIHEFSLTIKEETKHFEARILADDQNEVAVILRDFTEKVESEDIAKNQQKQLIQADKLATLGIMVSGVAHEINNPNNYILLNGKIISRMWEDIRPILAKYFKENGEFSLSGMPYSKANKKIGKLISGIPEGALRIKQIVETFKDFARQDSGELNQQVNLNRVLESSVIILNNLIKRSTNNFVLQSGENIPNFLGNSQQIEQVIINLITNSCQALISKNNKILVTTIFDSQKDQIILKVQDDGVGIPEKNMQYIFDPFFTSKRDSGGTGLGLSIAFKIVKSHGGTLSVDSQPGEGTCITVVLPVLQKN